MKSHFSKMLLPIFTLCVAASAVRTTQTPAPAQPPVARTSMADDSPVQFPDNGPLPTKYPPDQSARDHHTPEKDYSIFSTPERSLAQFATIQAEMPPGHFTLPPHDWRHLGSTRRILTQG